MGALVREEKKRVETAKERDGKSKQKRREKNES